MLIRTARAAFAGAILAGIGIIESAEAGGRHAYRECRPCAPCAPAYEPSRTAPVPSEPVRPMDQPQVPEAAQTPEPDATDPSIDFSSSAELAGGPQTLAPFMMGDLFGVGGNFFLGFQNAQSQGVSANNATPINGGRRLKIGEFTSPMPRDRFFFTYNMFRGAYRTQAPAGGVDPIGTNDGAVDGPGSGMGAREFGPAGAGGRNFDVNRFTFGVEKTFFDGLTSVEVRVPSSYSLNTALFISDTAVPGDSAYLLDNVSTSVKGLLYQSRQWALSTGMTVSIPTADDVFIRQQFTARQDGNPTGQTLGHTLLIRNESVHILPFLGALYTPSSRLFMQGFVQVDVPLNQNGVVFTPNNNGVIGSPQFNDIEDQALLLFDVSAGYWVWRSARPTFVRGVAPIVEVHYTTTVNNADLIPIFNNVSGSNYQGIVGNTLNRLDVVNLTMGTTVQVGDNGLVTAGACIPLNRADNQAHNFLFDWEFLLQFNYRFGAPTRYSQSPIQN